MSDNDMANVPALRGAARGERVSWRVIAGRCHPDDVYLIDRAALEIGTNRAHFLIASAVERAREIVGNVGRAA